MQCGQMTLIFSGRTAVYDGPFQERATLCNKFQNEIAVSQGTWQFGNCLMPAKWVFKLLKGCGTSRNFYLLPVSHPIIKLPGMTCAVIGSHICRRSKCSVPLAFQQTVIQKYDHAQAKKCENTFFYDWPYLWCYRLELSETQGA